MESVAAEKVVKNPSFNDDILLPERSSKIVSESGSKKSKRNIFVAALTGICIIAVAVCVAFTTGFGSTETKTSQVSFSQNIVDGQSTSLKALTSLDDDTIENCFGTANLTVESHTVSSENIVVQGSTQVHELPSAFTAIIHNDDDIVIENQPTDDEWSLSDVKLDLEDDNGWENSSSVFIFSKTEKQHTVMHASHEGTSIPLKKGLNSIHNLSVVDNKPLSMIFGSNPSTAAEGRLLKASDFYLKIYGSLKPTTNLKSVLKVEPISIGSGLTLTKSTFAVDNIKTSDAKYSLESTLTITSPSTDDIHLAVKGELDNHSYLISGTLDKLEFGNGDKKMTITDVEVTIRGTRDTQGNITTSGTLIGTVGFGEKFSSTLTLNLPITPSATETVSFGVNDIPIDDHMTVTTLKGVLSNKSPYLELVGVAKIATKAINTEIDVTATFSKGGAITFTGKVDHLKINIGDKGFNLSNVVLTMAEDANKHFSCSLKSEFTFAGFEADGHLSFLPGTHPIMDLSFKSLESKINAFSLASHFTNVPSSSGTSESVYDKLLKTNLSLDTLAMHLNLELKTFVMSGLTNLSEKIKNVPFRLEVDSIKKHFGVGFSLHNAFKLSDIIPKHVNLDGYTLKSGSFVFANHDESFELGSETIKCLKGIVFSGEMTLPKISSSMQTPDIKISASFGADAHDVTFSGTLTHFQIGKDIRVKSGSLALSTKAPHLALSTSATLTAASQSIPFTASFDFSQDSKTHKHIVALSGSVGEVKLGAHKNIDLKSVAFKLNDNGEGFHGQITSSLVFGSVVLKTELDYPLSHASYLDLYVPDIRISSSVHLKEVTLDINTKTSTGVKFSATLVDTLSSANTIKMPVSGTFTATSFSLDGKLGLWHVAQTGVEASNLSLKMAGKLDSHHQATITSGSIGMDLHVFGAEVTASLSYPRSGSDLKLAVSKLPIGKEVIASGALDLKFDSHGHAEMLTLNGNMELKLSHSQNAKLSAVGHYKKGGAFDVSGKATQVHLGKVAGSDITMKELGFSIKGEAGKTTTYSGKLDAKMALGSVTLDVELDYPLKNAEVDLKIPNLRLTKHASLSNVDLSFEESSKTIGLAGTLNLAFDHESKLHNLNLHVTGSIVGDKVTLTGSVSKWNLPVGHKGTSVSGLKVTVHTTMKNSASHTSIALQGNVAYSPYELSLNGTFDSNTEVVTLKLTFKNTHAVKVASLFDKMITDPSSHEIPSDIHDKVTKATLTSASIELITKPWKIIVKGDARVFGNDDLGIQAIISEDSSKKWSQTTAISLTNAFSFSKVIPAASHMNEFKWTEGLLAMTNAPSSTVQFAGKSVTVKNGVFFEALLPMVHLSQRMQKLKMWSHVESFTFSAQWNKSSSTIQFIAELPKNMPVGKDVTVDGKLVINYTHSKVSLDIIAEGHITMAHGLEPLHASVDIEVDNSGFELTGSVSEYTVPVGHKGMKLESVTIKISEKNSVFKGDLTAKVFIGHAELTAEVTIPRPDNSQGVEIMLKEKNQRLNVNDILSHTCESSIAKAVKMPGDMSSVTKNPLLDAEIIIKTSPLSFTVEADLAAFKGREVVNIELEISEINGVWGFGFGIGIKSGFKFQDIMPSFGALSKLPAFVDGAFAVAYQQQPFIYKIGQLEVSIDRGIAFGARAHAHHAIQKWTGIEFVEFKGAINTATHSVHLEADIEMNWHLGSLYFYEAGVFLDIGGIHGFDLGIKCNMMIHFKDHSQLKFGVKVMLSVTDIIVDGYTLNDWHKPFGIKGLTIDHSEAEVGFSYALVPEMFGVSGGLEIGKEKGSMTVYVDPSNGIFVVAGSINKFNLGGMLSTLTSAIAPHSKLSSVLSIYLKDLEMELNTARKAISFNQHTYNPGFLFNVGEFDAFGLIKGDGHLMINPHVGVSMSGHIQPFNFAHGLVEVSGYGGSSHPATVDIALGAGMNHFKVDGRISVAHFFNAGAKIEIDNHGIIMDTDVKIGAMKLISKLHAVTRSAGHPSDFSFSAEIDNVGLGSLISGITGKMKQALDHLLSHVRSAEAKVAHWRKHEEPKIRSNDAKINRIVSEKHAHYSREQSILSGAMHHLEHEKAVVRSYSNTINHYKHSKKHCHHWYHVRCHAHNAWLDAKIAATWVAEKAALAAVNVAEAAVRVAKSAVKVEERAAVHLNAEIVALKTENAAIKAAGRVAEDALKVAEKIVRDTGKLAQWGMSRLGHAFRIKRAYVSASSLSGTKHSGRVTLGLEIELFGHDYHWKLSMKFPPSLKSMEESVWSEVKKHI